MNKLFAYPGGKWPIRHLVVSAFPGHKTYVDVFGGSAAILLTKEPSALSNTVRQSLPNVPGIGSTVASCGMNYVPRRQCQRMKSSELSYSGYGCRIPSERAA